MDDYAPPVIPEDVEEATPEQEFEVAEEPQEEGNAEPEPQISLEDLQAKIKAFESRIGTEDDVRTVKSQRDQLRNELEQVRPLVEQLQASVSQITQQRTMDADAAFENQWAQYVASQPDATRQELARREYLTMKQRRDNDRVAAALQARAQQMAQAEQGNASQQVISGITALVSELARSSGVDPSKLDMSSAPNIIKSYQAEAQRIQRLKSNPSPQPGHPPQRMGSPAPAKTMTNFFGDAAAKGDWATINRAFQEAESRNMSLEEFLQR